MAAIVNQYAVCVRHAYKDYGSKNTPFVVLKDFNLAVPTGHIFGLLGASGCGKTTLLNSIVGLKKLDSGDVEVLGISLNSEKSDFVGPSIGYMPQKISLCIEFTIKETMKYFGWIAQMTTEQICDRLEFLQTLLMLPDSNQKIKHLSGGQQRRISFAVSLLHDPELLILDEPTVGLDPILRETVWNYLLNITDTGKKTVILTTHYIDEARQAHRVGLMRGGQLLIDDSPSNLLMRYNADNLETVFYNLSIQQDQNIKNIVKNISLGNDGNNKYENSVTSKKLKSRSNIFGFWKKSHLKTLIWKNFMWMLKNMAIMFTIVLSPTITISLFSLTVGHTPKGIHVGVINYETNITKCDLITCNSTRLSCNYLDYLKHHYVILVNYDSEKEAEKSIHKGKIYASITFPNNYTKALKQRLEDGKNVAEWDIKYSSIDVFRDVAVRDIAAFLKKYIYESFKQFIGDYLESCSLSKKMVSLPLHWNKPIYGNYEFRLTEHINLGVIVTLIFFYSAALTAYSMLAEQNEGILERFLVMGIRPIEIMIAHIFCDFFTMIGICLFLFLSILLIFDVTLNGSLTLVIIFSLFIGFCGMCFGFVLFSLCRSEFMSTFILLGLYFPIFSVSGIIWPINGMHSLLQQIVLGLPFTQAIQSIRDIFQKGWNLNEPSVWKGLLMIAGWTVIFLIVGLVFLKNLRK